MIDAVDWSNAQVLRGTGADLAESLWKFANAKAPDEASRVWWDLEGVAFAQDTIYGASEATAEVMLAAMADRPPAFLREWILEVLRFILTGGSTVDGTLAERCHAVALGGVWLLAAEAAEANESAYQDAVVELLTIISPAVATVVKTSLGTA